MSSEVRLTHVGGPTLLIELDGWRLLTDPTFDAPGRRYSFGWGASSRKLSGPALPAEELGPIDAILLSHDHHGDNLDTAGRALLPSAGVVVTTVSGAGRLGGKARGLEPWAGTVLEAPGLPALEVTATPCRHGPPGAHFVYGDVIGFALRRAGSDERGSGSRATPCSTTACGRWPTGSRSTSRCCTWAGCSSRSPGRFATR